MQVPFFQRRPGFVPRGPRFRGPSPHWRQPPPQEFSNEFWCETCDRGFRTNDILEKHKQQHQKCNIDGCQYIAHPKVITKHIQMQHSSGLYKKIAKLQDPDEIRKWREERKKKYPTKENVQKAAAALKEKIDRGEKMGLKNNRHVNKLNMDSGNGGKKQPFNKRSTRQFNESAASDSKRRRITPKKLINMLPAAENSRKLKPFAGIQELIMDTDEPQDEPENSFTIEDEDELADATNTTEATSGSVCLALSSLICDYGSTDEEDGIQATLGPTSISKTTIIPHKNQNVNRTTAATSTSNQVAEKNETKSKKTIEDQVTSQTKNESDDDSGPEEVKVTKEVISATETKIRPLFNKKKAKDNISRKLVHTRPKPKLPSTLLHKLLFKEMKHERNVVLQCIRHAVKNNFFDKSV